MSKPNSIQFANAIEQVKHELPLHLEKQRIKANLYMNMYKALKKEGFTDEQAMDIIKARGYE
ncbi:hypothetical protein [Oceanobacillus indicireducens]|uniref:Uncharacterized protein n=1 Tax=Oceanobacillus indicireducens TaxID=1004261 RepID=A0A918D4Y4_9BACI|nr:hypothetical protein [Oceanobacillus indicireducens]GGN66458.1 hypothetical protein GCM10007971_36490 [Oceanobacillus indicireducens]